VTVDGKKYRVAYATGSRADYGIVRNYIKLLDEDTEIDFEVLVTGALTHEEYGRQQSLIEQDGYTIRALEIPIDTSDNYGIVHAMSCALDKFGVYFRDNKYDLLILLGDRYEIFSVAIAAAMQRITILHIHGGELTYGNYDEFIRHCITKMSGYHFAATETYRKRIIQLGEKPENVYWLGALGAENCIHIDESKVNSEVRDLSTGKYFAVLFHPETLTDANPESQISNVLAALDTFFEYDLVFLGTNADTHADVIRQRIGEYIDKRENAHFFENLNTESYHYLLKNAVCLIGNSSSGMIEAPSLMTWTVNIGDRQRGRERGNSVIDVPCIADAIIGGIRKAIGCQGKDTVMTNPYYKKDAAANYYKTTKLILGSLQRDGAVKEFYDIAPGIVLSFDKLN